MIERANRCEADVRRSFAKLRPARVWRIVCREHAHFCEVSESPRPTTRSSSNLGRRFRNAVGGFEEQVRMLVTHTILPNRTEHRFRYCEVSSSNLKWRNAPACTSIEQFPPLPQVQEPATRAPGLHGGHGVLPHRVSRCKRLFCYSNLCRCHNFRVAS